MSNAATLSMMAKAGTGDAARAATLAKKAAQARARRAKKKGTSTPELFDAPPSKSEVVQAAVKVAERMGILKKTKRPAPVKAKEPMKQGGKRENAGRKAIYGTEVMHTISFKGTSEHRAEFLAAGGGNWVRAGLDERIAFKAKGGK